MTLPTPSKIAIRAVKQYRGRDVVPYLSLRYYLANCSSRRERWHSEVATRLVVERGECPYFRVEHFKERDEQGHIHHRELHLPGANEILAEGVLLAECSNYPAFENGPSVFSYDLAEGPETDGMYRPYFGGLQRQHEAIAKACKADAHSEVLYGDVKKFYPSISREVAERAWKATCDQAHINPAMTDLGLRLIECHASVERTNGRGILTGPMFSHLIGNLVLRRVDREVSLLKGISYFRYVDDVVLVGPRAAVDDGYRELDRRLREIGLELHPPGSGKHLRVSSAEWLQGEHDFSETPQPIQWKSFVLGLKCLLIREPKRHGMIRQALQDAGFRLPLPNYEGVIREQTYLQRVSELIKSRWLRGKTRTLDELVEEANILRDRYRREIDNLLSSVRYADAFYRKRTLPKIRYRAGRLAYLATHQQLAGIAEELRDIRELQFQGSILMGIALGDATEAIRFGTNATQALAQALHAEGRAASIQGPIGTGIEAQGLAVMALNGVATSGAGNDEWCRNEFVRIARDGVEPDLMRSSDPFVREFASLHGLGAPRHAQVLDTAFDEAEDSVFDTVSQQIFSASG